MNFVTPLVIICIAVLLFLLKRSVKMRIMQERPSIYMDYEKCSPWLFTLNGCGFRLYTVGRQDVSTPLPSHSSYLFLCLFFIPLIPISCYRVADVGEGQYYIFGNESWSLWEIVYLYMTYYCWVIGVIGILWLLLLFI